MKPSGSQMRKMSIQAISILLACEAAFAQAPQCSDVFHSLPTQRSSNIQDSLDGIIHDLSSMRLYLDRTQMESQHTVVWSALAKDYAKEEDALVHYLLFRRIMTREQLLERIKQEILQIQAQEKEQQIKNEKIKKTVTREKNRQEKRLRDSFVDGSRMVFHRIEPGTFKMGESQSDVTLTNSFEMMATPTTQVVWRKVAELANQKFPKTYQIALIPSHFEGDTRPVESISYMQIQNWIQALNALSAKGEPGLNSLIPHHKKGDIYRLPTEAEWEYVVTGQGQYKERYHFGNQESQLKDYAWFQANSGRQTQPVATKKPLTIHGKEFYDFYGNVAAIVSDWFDPSAPPAGGVNPQGTANPNIPKRGQRLIVRGSDFVRPASEIGSRVRSHIGVNEIYKGAGFRLVREVRN